MAYLKCLFRGLCVLLSICATVWPIHRFNLNKNALEIELKDLHSSKDTVYPGIRLCFAHTILHGYATPSRSTLTTKNPMQDSPDPAKFQIDHYIRKIVIIHANKTRPKFTRTGMKTQQSSSSIQRKGNFTHIVLRRFQASDCLDIGIPFKENLGIHSISVEIEKDIFKKQAVPTRNEIMSGTSKVAIGMSSNGNIFHLPNHNGADLLFNDLLRGSCSAVGLDVKGMELFYRRKKPGVRCIGYDGSGMFKFLTRSTKMLGCMPDGLDLPINLPRCLGNKTKTAANKVLSAMEQFLTYPCRSIRDLKIEYNFDDLKNNCKTADDTLQITANFNKFLFKEIKQVRAFTIGNLASSIGVIIGIFYGVSLIEVPDMVRKSLNKMERNFSKKGPHRRKSQVLVHQALDALRIEVEELDGRFKNAKRTLRNEGRERIEGLRNEVGELHGKFENAKNDIFLVNNEGRERINELNRKIENAKNDIVLTLDAIRNDNGERIEGLRKEVGELNGKFQNAKKDIFLVDNKGLDTIRHVEKELNEELQNARMDITLIRNTEVTMI